METRKEKIQTPIPLPIGSPRKSLSSDKIISEELTATVSPSTATTFKVKSKTKAKGKVQTTSIKSKILRGSIAGMCRRRGLIKKHLKSTFVTNEFFMGKIQEFLDHCNNILISKEFVARAPGIIAELFHKHMKNTTLNLYPTTSSSIAEMSNADLQHQLYLEMKSKPQDQAADPELWEILKTKFDEL
ncbi:hypothetical protein Tco_1492347 [Tanacetum coccineum]